MANNKTTFSLIGPITPDNSSFILQENHLFVCKDEHNGHPSIHPSTLTSGSRLGRSPVDLVSTSSLYAPPTFGHVFTRTHRKVAAGSSSSSPPSGIIHLT